LTYKSYWLVPTDRSVLFLLCYSCRASCIITLPSCSLTVSRVICFHILRCWRVSSSFLKCIIFNGFFKTVHCLNTYSNGFKTVISILLRVLKWLSESAVSTHFQYSHRKLFSVFQIYVWNTFRYFQCCWIYSCLFFLVLRVFNSALSCVVTNVYGVGSVDYMVDGVYGLHLTFNSCNISNIGLYVHLYILACHSCVSCFYWLCTYDILSVLLYPF
jgi:hypothetical protein